MIKLITFQISISMSLNEKFPNALIFQFPGWVSMPQTMSLRSKDCWLTLKVDSLEYCGKKEIRDKVQQFLFFFFFFFFFFLYEFFIFCREKGFLSTIKYRLWKRVCVFFTTILLLSNFLIIPFRWQWHKERILFQNCWFQK